MESSFEGDPANNPDPISSDFPGILYIFIEEGSNDWVNTPGTTETAGNNEQSMEDVWSTAILPASQPFSTMTQPDEIPRIESHDGRETKKGRLRGKGKAHLFTRTKKKTVSKAKGLLRSKRISVNQQTHKNKPSATGVYTEAEVVHLKLQMTRKCPYCHHEANRRPELKSHALNECPALRQDPNVVKVLEMCAGPEKNIITATECNYEASSMDGLAYFCSLKYPEGAFVAPFNWLFLVMDPNRLKGQPMIRRTAPAHQYQNIKTGELRTRRYTDRSNHVHWKTEIREKIVKNEVKTLVIPTCFFYVNANIFSTLQHRDHCALLVLTFKDGQVQNCTYYESPKDKRFHKRVSNRAVITFIQSNILSGLTHPQPKLQTYKSLATDGCQSVLCYYLHQIFSGLEICDPPNVDILNAWKTFSLPAFRLA